MDQLGGVGSVDRYAVIGHPVAHSQSPIIHAAFAKQTQQNIRYERVLAPLDGFVETVRDLMQQGYQGVNVTVPFKFSAFQFSDHLTARAKAAGAVNTLSFSANGVTGDNTDGVGLVHDIQKNLGVSLKQKRVLLLGAGGAASGVLLPLLLEQPSHLTLANRSLEKAQALQQQVLQQLPTAHLACCDFSGLQGMVFDIVINATSAGLGHSVLPLPSTIFAPQSLAYDMMYGKETSFMQQARASGARVADGLGMLVEQAAEAFFLWRGVRPETAPVIHLLRTS